MLRYLDLKNLELAGKIKNLEYHVEYPIVVNSENICKYEADYRYITLEPIVWSVTTRKKITWNIGDTVVEDSKGVRTAVYVIKCKLIKVLYGITIYETGREPKTRKSRRKKQ